MTHFLFFFEVEVFLPILIIFPILVIPFFVVVPLLVIIPIFVVLIPVFFVPAFFVGLLLVIICYDERNYFDVRGAPAPFQQVRHCGFLLEEAVLILRLAPLV